MHEPRSGGNFRTALSVSKTTVKLSRGCLGCVCGCFGFSCRAGEQVLFCFGGACIIWKWLIVNRRKRSHSRSAFPIHLQVNSLQQVIKLTKENLDKIEGQFLNVQHPPSIFLEVGDDFRCLACRK